MFKQDIFSWTKENFEKIENEIKFLSDEINKLNLTMAKKEDDLKDIINEKDIIIRNLNNELLEHKNIIKNNKAEILKLNNKINEKMTKFNSELNEK